MKKLVVLILILSFNQTIKAQIEVGPGIAVFKDYEDKIIGLELKSNFYLGKKLAISPSFTSYFPLEDGDPNSFFANIDVHYDIYIVNKFSIYPVIGFGVAGGSFILPVLNSGIGASYFISNKFKLFTEAKTINFSGGPEFSLGLLYTIKKKKINKALGFYIKKIIFN